MPQTFLPRGLEIYPDEGFGEVQTPFKVNACVQLDIGDIVLLRPAKGKCERIILNVLEQRLTLHYIAGEIAERFDRYLVWDHKRLDERFETYRGLKKTFF